jgi:2-C-methyl-D-erythritol 2,4-cyclodiphosphate synthase
VVVSGGPAELAPLHAIRVGQGVDVHPMVPGRPLVLGGVTVPYDRGLGGHSDADVVAHAVCDALLGAAGLGDLGGHFPPEDPRWTGTSSLEFCRYVGKLLAETGWQLGNADVAVLCDQPRLAPFVPAMVGTLAAAFGVAPDRLRIVPKSCEGLGFAGRGEGICAIAVCMLLAGGTG